MWKKHAWVIGGRCQGSPQRRGSALSNHNGATLIATVRDAKPLITHVRIMPRAIEINDKLLFGVVKNRCIAVTTPLSLAPRTRLTHKSAISASRVDRLTFRNEITICYQIIIIKPLCRIQHVTTIHHPSQTLFQNLSPILLVVPLFKHLSESTGNNLQLIPGSYSSCSTTISIIVPRSLLQQHFLSVLWLLSPWKRRALHQPQTLLIPSRSFFSLSTCSCCSLIVLDSLIALRTANFNYFPQ